MKYSIQSMTGNDLQKRNEREEKSLKADKKKKNRQITSEEISETSTLKVVFYSSENTLYDTQLRKTYHWDMGILKQCQKGL